MDPIIGEIRLMAFFFEIEGWKLCDGSLMKVADNAALFSLIGNAYGGDGRIYFKIPDFREFVPMHSSEASPKGAIIGKNHTALSIANMPAHSHIFNIKTESADSKIPTNAVFAQTSGNKYYSNVPNPPTTVASAQFIQSTGVSKPFSNIQPVLGLGFYIATTGIYPSTNQ